MQYNDGLKKLVLAFSSGSPIFHRVPLYFLSGAHIFLRVPLYFLSGAHIFLRVPIFFIGYPYFSSGTHIAANFVCHLVNTEEEKQHGHHDVHRKLKEKKHL